MAAQKGDRVDADAKREGRCQCVTACPRTYCGALSRQRRSSGRMAGRQGGRERPGGLIDVVDGGAHTALSLSRPVSILHPPSPAACVWLGSAPFYEQRGRGVCVPEKACLRCPVGDCRQTWKETAIGSFRDSGTWPLQGVVGTGRRRQYRQMHRQMHLAMHRTAVDDLLGAGAISWCHFLVQFGHVDCVLQSGWPGWTTSGFQQKHEDPTPRPRARWRWGGGVGKNARGGVGRAGSCVRRHCGLDGVADHDSLHAERLARSRL